MNDLLLPKHFNYCPKCGSDAVKPLASNSNTVECDTCGFLLYFNPSCSAGALIEDSQGRLLVIERANEPSKGKYGIPGGFTDYGEHLEVVVAREVKEEVNLDLSSFEFFASFPNEYPYKSVVYPVVDTYFLATVDSFDELQADTSEVAGIKFFDPGEVPSEQWAFPSLRSAIKLYLERKG